MLMFPYGCGQNLSKAQKVYNTGCPKLRNGDYAGAIADFTESIRLDPNQTAAYNNRAIAKIHLNDYKGAITDYENIVRVEPNKPDGYEGRGRVKLYLEDFGGAIIDFNKAIEVFSGWSSDDLYILRGDAKYGLKDFKGAIADYSKACKDGQFEKNLESTPFVKRGIAKSQINDKKGAIDDYNKAINIHPNNKEAYYYRGLAKVSLGQKNAGCMDLSKAGELGYASAYEAIAIYCQ